MNLATDSSFYHKGFLLEINPDGWILRLKYNDKLFDSLDLALATIDASVQFYLPD